MFGVLRRLKRLRRRVVSLVATLAVVGGSGLLTDFDAVTAKVRDVAPRLVEYVHKPFEHVRIGSAPAPPNRPSQHRRRTATSRPRPPSAHQPTDELLKCDFAEALG